MSLEFRKVQGEVQQNTSIGIPGLYLLSTEDLQGAPLDRDQMEERGQGLKTQSILIVLTEEDSGNQTKKEHPGNKIKKKKNVTEITNLTEGQEDKINHSEIKPMTNLQKTEPKNKRHRILSLFHGYIHSSTVVLIILFKVLHLFY